MGVELLGALLAPRWPQMRSGPPVELHLEASWSLCWRQDGPSGAKMSQVGIKLAVKFGKLRTKRRILYIHKLPITRKAATMLITHYYGSGANCPKLCIKHMVLMGCTPRPSHHSGRFAVDREFVYIYIYIYREFFSWCEACQI